LIQPNTTQECVKMTNKNKALEVLSEIIKLFKRMKFSIWMKSLLTEVLSKLLNYLRERNLVFEWDLY